MIPMELVSLLMYKVINSGQDALRRDLSSDPSLAPTTGAPTRGLLIIPVRQILEEK